VIRLLEARANLRRKRWDHDEVRAAFDTHFANRGFLFSRRDAEDFGQLLAARLAADYDMGPTPRIARRSLLASRRFIERIAEVTNDQN
jgi:hypothetical protein